MAPAASCATVCVDPPTLADYAVDALIEEASLTPKPALVDRRSSGVHRDLDFDIMVRSARSLRSTFEAIARVAASEAPSQSLRERLGRIGREGEQTMLRATGGSNAHRGAIWIVGLLCAGAAQLATNDIAAICKAGAQIAHFEDRFVPASATTSHGARVTQRYGVGGARGEAREGFPHVVSIGWPALQRARDAGLSADHARLEALVSIMATLDDTCVLHRGGWAALHVAQRGAAQVMEAGGLAAQAGHVALAELDRDLVALNASPGGAADLLAATLFLDSL